MKHKSRKLSKENGKKAGVVKEVKLACAWCKKPIQKEFLESKGLKVY